MAGQTVIAGIVCLFVLTLASEKRILLNDPAYVSQQLTHLQSELQELRVKAGNQEQTVSTFQQTVSTLQQTVSTLQQTVTNQQQNISDQQQAMSSQQQAMSSQQQAMSSQQQTISTLQQTVTNQQSVIMKMAQERCKGVVYTRWGRKDCPAGNDTQLVYSGFAGGSFYTSPGGAANTLCMPREPVWGSSKDKAARDPAFVYGAEYEDPGMFGMPNLNEDVSCAVCRNTVHSVITMVPGRATCYPGWTEAFHGLLTAGNPRLGAASEYLCVDEHPQAVLGGGNTNDDGRVFFAVLSKCGSLPCPPYEDGKTLPCSVCMM
ncbi:uncharacterized protein LOC110453347 [Mizuhopecten yessoensis]|uniref:uncharacterized protein LOC110453347 n=1 Tax=Mizuhopecten yessoensis TaxID=6573 RepID=UPI000B457CEC|nr:uncharacterized protein LOC110453347 [Mizuhopecten yessoensis]